MSAAFGVGEERRAAASAEMRERRRAAKERNDGLLGSAAFREVLAEIADRGELLAAARPMDDWRAGYVGADRDIVNGILANSTLGPEWLAEYAKAKTTERERND